MARLELNQQDMFKIAKSIIKPQEKMKKLYINRKHGKVKVDDKSGYAFSSIDNSVIMYKEALVNDAEELTEYFKNPEADGNLSRVEAQKALDELKDNITRYFREPYYHCDHSFQMVEHQEETFRECEYCSYQPEQEGEDE